MIFYTLGNHDTLIYYHIKYSISIDDGSCEQIIDSVLYKEREFKTAKYKARTVHMNLQRIY